MFNDYKKKRTNKQKGIKILKNPSIFYLQKKKKKKK